MDNYRLPNELELAILKKLLEKNFPERDRLSKQLDRLLVRTIDKEGSLSLKVSLTSTKKTVEKRLVSEGYYFEEPGSAVGDPAVHILLYVNNGLLSELEIYKDDGSPIKGKPTVQELIIE